MSARTLSQSSYLALKAATRRAVVEAGGVKAASASTRVSPSVLSGYGLPHDGSFTPADVIADLEATAGRPVITEVLAGLAGYRLVRDETLDDAPSTADLGRGLASLSAQLGQLSQCWIAASADNQITPAEARDLRNSAADLVLAVGNFMRGCDGALAPKE